MKKSKLIAGLSAAFVGMIVLASCSGYVKAKDGVVLHYGDKDYTAEELFNDDKSAAGAEAKFNAVYKVAVRQYFKTGQDEVMKRIAKDTENKVSGQKATAQSNADKNGTSYDTEWKKILTSNNVDDEQGLYDKFEYEFQKEEFDDQFYEKKFDVLKDGGKILDTLPDTEKMPGYLAKKQPYHVKHILVKVGAAEKDYKTGEITAEQATKLSNVVRELANGTDFATVAKWYSDDTGSAGDNGGDLGIMDRDTSFVNEFKLGTYIYESFFSSTTTSAKEEYKTKVAKEAFGLTDATTEDQPGFYADKVAKVADPSNEGASSDLSGLGQIPYEAALAIGDKDYTVSGATKHGYATMDDSKKHFKDITGEEIKAKYLPRNVLFNKYFNKRNIMVITPRTCLPTGTTTVDSSFKKRTSDDKYRGSFNSDFAALPGFNESKKKNDETLNITMTDDSNNTSPNVLRDKEGRIIFCFRSGTSGEGSYQGIHFVCIERSPFVGLEFENDTRKAANESVNLDEYYTHYYPGQEGTTEGHEHPKYADGKDKLTYVSYFNTEDVKEKKSRADTVKSKIKGYNPNLNTYIYRSLLKNGDLKFADTDLAKGIQNDIETWIDLKRESTDYDANKTWNDTWKTYALALEEQTKERKPVNIGSEYIKGTITDACFYAFTTWEKGTDDSNIEKAFGKGGVFHD